MKKKLPKKLWEIQDEKQKIIGKRITKLSTDKITIEDLAEKLELSSAMIKKYRGGDSAPAIGTLFRLAEIFECDVDYLLGILPEDQKTYVSKNLKDLTGLDSEACSIIDSQLSKVHSANDALTMDTYNWLIKNGIFDIIRRLDNLCFNLSLSIGFYNALPNLLKRLISSVSVRSKDNHIEITHDGEKELAVAIQKMDLESVKSYNTIFEEYDFDDAIAKHEKYTDVLAYATTDPIAPKFLSLIGASQDKETLNNKYGLTELRKLEYEYNATNKIPGFEHDRSTLYDNCYYFITKYNKAEIDKEIGLFWISEMFNDITKQYIESFIPKNIDCLKSIDVIKEGDEK